MGFELIKRFLPDRDVPIRVLRGPFRGARIIMNPRHSLRKMFGLYEHELNAWLEETLPRVNRVIDVGANDGYFTFGCAAAFKRLRQPAQILAFEPQNVHFRSLQQTLAGEPLDGVGITIFQSSVGRRAGPATHALDSVQWQAGDPEARCQTLLKIDVEGAELEVLSGAVSWMNPTNYFLIEVHHEPYIGTISGMFQEKGLDLRRVNQRPLPLIGREMRSEHNWWLVSDPGFG